jgi:hypothetical protein
MRLKDARVGIGVDRRKSKAAEAALVFTAVVVGSI